MLNKYKDLALNNATDDAVHIKRVEGQNLTVSLAEQTFVTIK